MHPDAETVDLLQAGTLVLARMEANGIRIDVDYLDALGTEIGAQVKVLEKKLLDSDTWKSWMAAFGTDANLNSQKQLGDVLFRIRGLETVRRTKKGGYSTTAKSLLKLRDDFVDDYLKWKKLHDFRVKSITGLRREVVNGYLHPNFSLYTATTYRSSSGADKD